MLFPVITREQRRDVPMRVRLSDGSTIDVSIMDRNPTAADLDPLPTLCQGQAADLKLDDGTYRYWLHRTGIEDGEPYENTISVEKLENGRWIDIDSYDGGPIA